jgi:molybdenum cofactor sulfurtransferase
MDRFGLFVSRHVTNFGTLIMAIGIISVLYYRASGPAPITPLPAAPYRRARQISGNLQYQDLVKSLRTENIPQAQGVGYFDSANRPFFTDAAFENFSDLLHTQLYGNTHSESPSAEKSTSTIDDARVLILNWLGTKLSQYTVIFTYSAPHSMKTVVEAFPFNRSGTFFYTDSSDESILGLRGLVREKGGKLESFQIDETDDLLSYTEIPENFTYDFNLVAFPLVDAFDGSVVTEKQLNYVFNKYQTSKSAVYGIIGDATLYLQTRQLSLQQFPFHAITFSFERLFGFPNIGALVIRNTFVRHLVRPYFGGGTLVYALPSCNFEKMRITPSARFEDGSLPFLSIAAIETGFKFWENLNFDRITNHVEKLKEEVISNLNGIRHQNGSPVIRIYGHGQSSIIAFNVLSPESIVVPYREVVESAAKNDIYLIGGCHSTPGTCLKHLNISEAEIEDNISAMTEIGAIRLSIGWSTLPEEIVKLSNWLESEYKK